MRDDRDDPNRMIPIAKRPERLGLGLRSVNGVYGRAKSDPAFPPIYFFRGKNHVMAGPLAVYREVLARRKADKLAKLALAPSRKRRADHGP
jgi:hypothetical protein